MSESRQVLKLFLASSSDIPTERKIVREVVDSWNRSVGARRGWQVDVIGWDTHAAPGYGSDPQAIVNRQIANMRHYDLFVGLLKHRFGTPTPRAGSGTNEEFKRAVRAFQQTGRLRIMLYFSEAAFKPHGTEDMKQKQKVMDFRRSLQSQSLHWGYRSQAEFRRLFTEHFRLWIEEKTKPVRKSASVGAKVKALDAKKALYKKVVTQPPVSKKLVTEPPPIKPASKRTSKSSLLAANPLGVPNPKDQKAKAGSNKAAKSLAPLTKSAPKAAPVKSKRLIMLSEHFFHVDKVIENAAKWTVVIRPQSPEDETKIRKICDSGQRYNHLTLAYQYQVGSATVESSERSSEAKGDYWTLQLRFTPINNSMGMASLSDDLAQKRANWLLLAQKPSSDAATGTFSSSSWLDSQITGNSQDGEPIFPALWKRFQGDSAKFREVMQLWAVYRLLFTRTCESIVSLKLGPVSKGHLAVKFNGKCALGWNSQQPNEVSVEGRCPLEI